jgi:hypothetical protein
MIHTPGTKFIHTGHGVILKHSDLVLRQDVTVFHTNELVRQSVQTAMHTIHLSADISESSNILHTAVPPSLKLPLDSQSHSGAC